ncbi:MAG: hypothetical protein SVZ03_06545 [Spirochaetota bacterium]|nr:hypothetical protein [Spirochaetota bacterium]
MRFKKIYSLLTSIFIIAFMMNFNSCSCNEDDGGSGYFPLPLDQNDDDSTPP